MLEEFVCAVSEYYGSDASINVKWNSPKREYIVTVIRFTEGEDPTIISTVVAKSLNEAIATAAKLWVERVCPSHGMVRLIAALEIKHEQ